LKRFYQKRNHEFAWITKSGANEYARNFMNLLNQDDQKRDSATSKYYSDLIKRYTIVFDEDFQFKSGDSLMVRLELLLTINFFDYAKRNWKGKADEDLVKVGWLMERKNVNYEHLLDTLLKNNAHTISSFEPVYRQYALLKKYLIKYRSIERESAVIGLNDSIKELKVGDTAMVIAAIKKHLYLLEDYEVKDSTNLFNSALEDAVKRFQKRNGFLENGIIADKTLKALCVPIHTVIQQLLINMERCRWVPLDQEGDYLIVNIPAFKLLVYHHDSLSWTCNAIVGQSKLTSNTIIFNDTMEYIVFSPNWNIPQNILRKETLPAIKKNRNYLSTHNMEVVDFSGKHISSSSISWNKYSNHFPYIIRQKPGKDNALGLVKFLFPNMYDIYLHDTPTKSLFEESSRMFSHGCIRIEEPYKLAQFLLQQDTSWSAEKIKAAMNGGKEVFVKLKKKVPIFIVYFTAWVDGKGKLNLREDVYGHDEQMKTLLFAN
jgi:murein L,D-transpeptidase YcbB/YkuD